MRLMTQMSGIKKFGQKGNDALLKELNQLHTKDTIALKEG